MRQYGSRTDESERFGNRITDALLPQKQIQKRESNGNEPTLA